MHRLLVPPEELESDSPALSASAISHLRVVRPNDGETIELFDGNGRWRNFRVRRSGPKSYGLSPTSGVMSLPPRATRMTLFACVTKGSRWDWTVEKSVELGVSRIVPVVSERTIVRIDEGSKAQKRERWTRIAEEAARQSDAKWLPEISMPVTFAESIALVRETVCFVGALTNPPPETIGEALASEGFREGADYAVYVGPEGDFSPAELSALLEVARPVSFGPTILRAETAAIFAVSALKVRLDVFAR